MAPSSIYDQANITGHHTRVDYFSSVVEESHTIARSIKEAMCIRVNDPSLNRNIGKFQLSHIRIPLTYNSNSPLPQVQLPTAHGPNPHSRKGGHNLCQYLTTSGRYVALHQKLGTIPLAPAFTHHRSSDAICGKYYISTDLMKPCSLSW